MLLLVLCLTITDVKNEGCRVACVRDGYTAGKAGKAGCICQDVKDSYRGYIHRTMGLGEPPIAPFIPEAKTAGKLVVEFPEY